MQTIPESLKSLQIEGKAHAVSYLGNGLYSAAFRSEQEPSRVFLLTEQTDSSYRERDRSKEVLALARTYHNSKHIPAFKLHGIQRIEGARFEVWETKYSKSADSSQWEHVTDEATAIASVYPVKVAVIGAMAKELKVSASIVEALQDIERAAITFGLSADEYQGRHYHFDLHNGNFGLAEDGQTLILRDPITAFF